MRLVLRQLFVRKHQLEIVHVIDSAAVQPRAEFDAPIKNIISDLDKRRNKQKEGCESPADERYSHSNVSKGRIRCHWS